MDAEKIINLPRHHKKTFIALLIALYVISLMVAHFLFEQSPQELFLDQVKSVATAMITALFGLAIIFTFLPTQEKGEIIEIPAQKITKEFELLLSTANRWRYKGNFGRYLRGKVLPTLASRQNIHVIACLIDPLDEGLCTHHADYRGSINAIDKGRKYNADSVATEVIVTVILASWYVANRGMTIDLYFSRVFDPIRIDSNDDAMILTVEDRRSPALKITKNHFTASHFELQMQTARNQSRKVDLKGMRKGIELAEISESDVKLVMKRAELLQLCNRLSVAAILDACKKSKNPYEN